VIIRETKTAIFANVTIEFVVNVAKEVDLEDRTGYWREISLPLWVETKRVQAKRAVTVQIGGSEYRVRSDANEAHLQGLAQFIEAKLQERVQRSSRTLPAAHQLVIVALELADELITLRSRQEGVEQNMRHTLERAITRIDQALAEDDRHGHSEG
jgi:cell division protein ZapA (FtsZ GTPase activity inhibitor)